MTQDLGARTTLRLPAPLMKKLKLLAVHENTTLTALLEEGVQRVLDSRKAQRKEGGRAHR